MTIDRYLPKKTSPADQINDYDIDRHILDLLKGEARAHYEHFVITRTQENLEGVSYIKVLERIEVLVRTGYLMRPTPDKIKLVQVLPIDEVHWGESPDSSRTCRVCRYGKYEQDPIEKVRMWKCKGCGKQRAVGVPKCPRIVEIKEEYNADLRMTIKKEIFCECEETELVIIEKRIPQKTVTMFLWCPKLGHWSWWDFVCDLFKRGRKK